MELCEIFARYGLDVILITVANAAIYLLSRKTVLKNKPKLATVLTYVVGGLIFAVYKSIAEQDALFAFENISAVTERGLCIGTLTMLLSAAADKFSGGGAATCADAISGMLEGVVAEDKAAECAEEILSAAEKLDGTALNEAVAAAVEKYGGECDQTFCLILSETAQMLAKERETSGQIK